MATNGSAAGAVIVCPTPVTTPSPLPFPLTGRAGVAEAGMKGPTPEEVARYAKEEEANAVWYIIFVLSFYAISIVVLLVKYVRKERDHARFNFYYDEFVKREAFKSLVCDTSGKVIGHPYELCKVRVMTFEQLRAGAGTERDDSVDADADADGDPNEDEDDDGDSDGAELQADVDGCLDDENFAVSCKLTDFEASPTDSDMPFSKSNHVSSTIVTVHCPKTNSVSSTALLSDADARAAVR